MHRQNLDAYAFEVIQVPNEQGIGYQNPSGQAPSYQVPQQPQQTSVFNSYGQAPTQSETEDDLPF